MPDRSQDHDAASDAGHVEGNRQHVRVPRSLDDRVQPSVPRNAGDFGWKVAVSRIQGVGRAGNTRNLQPPGAQIDGDEQVAAGLRSELQRQLPDKAHARNRNELPNLDSRFADAVHRDTAQNAVRAIVK